MGKPNQKRMEREMKAKRAYSEMRAKVGRFNLTREEVAAVRASLERNRK